MGQVLPSRHTSRMWTASTQTVAEVRCVSAYSAEPSWRRNQSPGRGSLTVRHAIDWRFSSLLIGVLAERPVTSVERVPDSRPRVAQASRGHSGAGRVLPAARGGARGAPLLRYRGGLDAQAAGARVARQHPAVAECDRAVRDTLRWRQAGSTGGGTPRSAQPTGRGYHAPMLEEVKKRYVSHLLRTTHGHHAAGRGDPRCRSAVTPPHGYLISTGHPADASGCCQV